MSKILKQVAIDGTFWTCIYFGMYQGIEGFQDALLFALWALSVLLWIAVFGMAGLDEKTKQGIAEKAMTTPKWLSAYGQCSTWIEAMALAAFGHYILAALYLVGSLLARGKIYLIRDEYKGQANEQ